MPNRRPALYCAIFLTLFIVYGSLFPFDWQARPGGDPWSDMMSILFATETEASRVDFATNVLLSLPLAFCLMAWLTARSRTAAAASIGLAVLSVFYCLVLAIVVETMQLHVPGRVASKFDVMAQTIGAVIGVGLWFWRGERLWNLVFDWSPFNRKHSRWQQLSSLYLLLVYAYGLLPLDLTLSPQDLYEKWKGGKLYFVPFHALHHAQAMEVYQYASIVLIWAVAAWLIAKARPLSATEIVGRTALAAAALEFLQLFVVSRTTDTTDVVLAGLAALGVGFVMRNVGGSDPQGSPAPPLRAGQLSLLVLGLSCLTLALAWYPFVPRADLHAWRRQMELWQEAPLAAYFQSDPLTAATSALQKCLVFAPWGALASWLSWRDAGRSQFLSRLFLGWGCGLIVVVEIGKLFLDNKVSDPSNVALEALAMVLAYRWVTSWNLAKLQAGKPKAKAAAASAAPSSARIRWQWLWLTLPQIGLSMLAIDQLGAWPTLPYNLRALVHDRSFVQLLCLVVAALACVLPWVWWSSMAPSRRRWLHLALLAVVLPSLLVYPLLRVGAPEKLVFDIVGTPSFGWPFEIEPALRFAALNLIVLWGVISAHRWLDAPASERNVEHGIHWLVGSVLALTIWHVVVVDSAVTDNLVELMRGEGNVRSTVMLFLWWTLVYGSALQTGRVLLGQRPVLHLLGVLGAIVLSYWCAVVALEPMLVKYGQVFSALQFLLSQDRAHYAEPGSLLLRYLGAYAGLLLGLLYLLMPTLLAQRARQAPGEIRASAQRYDATRRQARHRHAGQSSD